MMVSFGVAYCLVSDNCFDFLRLKPWAEQKIPFAFIRQEIR